MHRDLIVVGEVRRGEACELTHASTPHGRVRVLYEVSNHGEGGSRVKQADSTEPGNITSKKPGVGSHLWPVAFPVRGDE